VQDVRNVDEDLQTEAITLIADLSQRLALLIARDPSVLKVIEWRDMERLLAEVFSGIGFDVTLTPASKDGSLTQAFPSSNARRRFSPYSLYCLVETRFSPRVHLDIERELVSGSHAARIQAAFPCGAWERD